MEEFAEMPLCSWNNSLLCLYATLSPKRSDSVHDLSPGPIVDRFMRAGHPVGFMNEWGFEPFGVTIANQCVST